MKQDYLKSADEFLNGEISSDFYHGTDLLESTIANIKSLSDITESARLLGKEIYQDYDQEKFDKLIEGLKKGFAEGLKQKEFDAEESKMITETQDKLFGKVDR